MKLCRPMRVLLHAAILVTVTSVVSTWAARPNIVWLISEDNSKHFLRLYDEMGAVTPRIEALAKEGLVFDNAFSNAPVCSVARTTLMTGCYAPRIGTQYHRKAVPVPLPDGVKMFPAWLRKAGYYTSNKQKKDYNAIEGEGVWDESSNRASWRNRSPGQPFFHMQSFGVTHESSLHFSETAMEQQQNQTNSESVLLAPYHPDTPTFRYTYARYHDRIREMDQQIGAVVDQLKADGLLEETFIFYFGDHGGVLPGSKGYARERGLHVPLLVRVPKQHRQSVDFKIGSRVQGFVSFVDFGATVLNLAGLERPEGIDGLPFLGPGQNQLAVSRRNEVFGYADRFDEKYDLVRVLRKGRYSYVRSFQPFNFDGLQNNYRYKMLAYDEWRSRFESGRLNPVERQFFEPQPVEALYDVEMDPHEVENLAAKPEFGGLLLEMRNRMETKLKGLPDLSFFPESYLTEHAFDLPTEFGASHRDQISELIDVANLGLSPFETVRESIERALRSKQDWVRYWGLIVCSSFSEVAKPMEALARKMAQEDEVGLVRVRAAEFLALIGAEDPRPVFRDVLETCRSGIEACLILNSVVLLQDGEPSYRFQEKDLPLSDKVASYPLVQRRLEYLFGPLKRF